MSALAAITSAVQIIKTAQELTALASQAIEAANNESPQEAESYLAQAREQYAAAREKWDNA